ncbi:SLIT-ROBO Rho GTPase-activating protein 2B-like, partial [Homarus americanus]
TELRSQLNEQLRALDGRVDTQTALVNELQDWFRRRAELHQDYATKLDKLAKSLQARHKEQRIKRGSCTCSVSTAAGTRLVNQTVKDARDQYAMADVYLNNVIPRFTQVQDDTAGNKYMDAKLKALKARNEYILSMDSANAAIHKNSVEDLSDIVDHYNYDML